MKQTGANEKEIGNLVVPICVRHCDFKHLHEGLSRQPNSQAKLNYVNSVHLIMQPYNMIGEARANYRNTFQKPKCYFV